MTCANAGIAVQLVEVQPAQLERARGIIAGSYAGSVKKGKLAQAEADARLGRIAYADVARRGRRRRPRHRSRVRGHGREAGRVRQLDRIARPGTILATNTSTLDVDAIAAVTARPQHVVGTALLQPGQHHEAARDRARRADLAQRRARARRWRSAKQLGKVGVVAGNCDGFIGNRMLYPYLREAEFVLEEGALAEQIDRVDPRVRLRRWAPSPCPTWPAWTSAGASASAATPSGRRSAATRPSPTRSASWAASARRPAPATTATRTAPHADPRPAGRGARARVGAANGIARRADLG